MSYLRTEILEAQKNRSDLVKWKLILVSTLGSIGIGLTSTSTVPNIQLVLCCIPFICVYVDVLAYHHALCINVIGQFMRTYSKSDDESSQDLEYMKDYEEFAWKARHLTIGKREFSAYDFERIIFTWSSVIFSFSTVIYGALTFKLLSIPIIISGSIGVISSIFIGNEYKDRRKKIREIDTALLFNKGDSSTI